MAALRRSRSLVEVRVELVPLGLHLGHEDAILGTLGSSERGLHLAQVEPERGGVLDLVAIAAPQALQLGVLLDQVDELGGAARELQVIERLLVHGEEAHRGAVLGGHVRDGGAIGERERVHAGAVELHELAHDAVLAKHLRDREHQVGGGGALLEAALDLEADDLGDEHVDGLAEHGGLGLDAAHAPAEHAQAVDHGGVGVRTHQRVRQRDGLAVDLRGEHHACEVLQVDLVHDAGLGRHHGEVAEVLAAPLEELVALLVALELEVAVDLHGLRGAVGVHLHRVIDHQVSADHRVDLVHFSAHATHGAAQRGEVDDGGHAREVLEHHAARCEGDLGLAHVLGVIARQLLDVLGVDDVIVEVAQAGLEQHLDGVRQAVDVTDARLLERVEAKHAVGFALYFNAVFCVERVLSHVCPPGPSG